jgi:hypothetical protein
MGTFTGEGHLESQDEVEEMEETEEVDPVGMWPYTWCCSWWTGSWNITSGGRSLSVLRREGIHVDVDGTTETGWKVGRGIDGITNLGAPRGTGPGGQRRRGLGAGRRGIMSVSNRNTADAKGRLFVA